MKSKLYRWYEQHDETIHTILDIMCEELPGGKGAKRALELLGAASEDKEERELKKYIQSVEAMVKYVEPKIAQLVNEVENIKGFYAAPSQLEKKKIIYKSQPLKEKINHLKFDVVGNLEEILAKNDLCLNYNKNIDLGSKYAVDRYIAHGGQGVLLKGRHIIADKKVAIKLLPKLANYDQNTVQMMRQEYHRLVDKLTHESIVQYRDIDYSESEHQWFLVMDYIEGKTLRDKIYEQKNFSLNEIRNILIPICNAVAYSHKNNIVHADIKPENILLDEENRPYLTDFGLSYELKRTFVEESTTKDIKGTLEYMAPEQLKGHGLRIQTDIWQLGIVMYELSCGQLPFQGYSTEHLSSLICKELPEELEDKEAWSIVQKALEKESSKRYQTVEELLTRLEKAPDASVEINEKKNGIKIEEVEISADKSRRLTDILHDKGLQLYEKKLYEKAYQSFEAAAKQVSSKSSLRMAIMHFEGKIAKYDYEKAREIFQMLKYSTDKEISGKAYLYLSYYKANGICGSQNYREEISLLERAAEKSELLAMFRLEYYYREGLYCEQDLKKASYYGKYAVDLAERKIKNHDHEAAYRLAMFNECYGNMSREESTEEYERAISYGSTTALVELGRIYWGMYLKDKKNEDEYKRMEVYGRALQLFNLSVREGLRYKDIYIDLMGMYAQHEYNHKKSLAVFDAAASYYKQDWEKGNSRSAFMLGWIYECYSLRQDTKLAISYLTQASLKDNTDACIRMANLYLGKGNLVKKNKEIAAKYAEQAFKLGDRRGKKILEELNSNVLKKMWQGVSGLWN